MHLRLAPPSVKLLAFQTCIRPKLEYACSAWHLHQSNLSKVLEAVQNHTARYIYSDCSFHTSITKLKSKAHLNNLELRPLRSRFRVFHKFYHSFLSTSLNLPAHRPSCRTNHTKAVYPPPALTTAHLRSFFVKAVRNWNTPPRDTVLHSDPQAFKFSVG